MASSDAAKPSLLLRCKVLVLGDAAVGKSALVQMFHSKGTHYPKQYVMTTGCDFVMKELRVPETNTTVELHIFDCSGSETFLDLTTQYWDNVNMIMLVYDATNVESFNNVVTWLEMVRKTSPDKPLPGVLVANKIDLSERVRVHTSEANEFARRNDLEFFQLSAHTNSNVDAPFVHLVEAFSKLYDEKLQALKEM